LGPEPCRPGSSVLGIPVIASELREQLIARERVGITLRPREAAAAAGLGPELEEVLARREPAQLRPVLPELCAAEERLIHQRLVREIPVVRVNLVEIAGAGEETSALEREAVAERERLEIRLF